MTRRSSWTQMAFDAVRKADSAITQRIANRAKSTPLEWTGTSIKDHLSPEDWKALDREITEQLNLKNDRSVAITCQAMVEDRLRWTIETKFIDGLSKTKKNSLFTGTGPLQSFAAKIDIAYALGLLTVDHRADLSLIGTIRNKFAHNFKPVRFSDPKIAALCAEFKDFKDFKKKGLATTEEQLMNIYGINCFTSMASLLIIGNLVLAGQSSTSSASPEKSE